MNQRLNVQRIANLAEAIGRDVRAIQGSVATLQGDQYAEHRKSADDLLMDLEFLHYHLTGHKRTRQADGVVIPPPTTEIRPSKSKSWSVAKALRSFHGLATIGWVLMIYPTIVYWSASVPYLVFLSIYTVIIDHAGAWATARIERQTEKKEQDNERT